MRSTCSERKQLAEGEEAIHRAAYTNSYFEGKLCRIIRSGALADIVSVKRDGSEWSSLLSG